RIAAAAHPWCPRTTSLRSSKYLLLTHACRGRADVRLVWRFVPEVDHRIGVMVLVPERADAGRAEKEILAGPGLPPEPPRREHSQEVSAREQQRVALDAAYPPDDTVGPGADLIGRLPSRNAIAEQLPVGTLGMDVGGGAALVRAVVPLHEI